MKSIAAYFLTTLLVVITGAAEASDMKSRIKSVDTDANIVMLENRVRLTYGDDVDEATLVPGSRVRVRYRTGDGLLRATLLKVLSGPRK